MPPTDVMERYLDAARRGDFETASAFFADDVVFRVPGRSRYAGEHRGKQAAVRYIEVARALSRDHHVELDLVDGLVSDDRFALILHERFDRGGETVDIARANVYRVRDGQIVEVWIFEGNQYEVDELFTDS